VETCYNTKQKYFGKDDLLQFVLNQSDEHFESIELEKGIFLDFDKNGSPSFFRIMDATKTFDTSKRCIKKIKIIQFTYLR